MSSVSSPRELTNKQLSPAEETFTDIKEIIVKSEEEIDGGLDVSETTPIINHLTDPLQRYVKKEDDSSDQSHSMMLRRRRLLMTSSSGTRRGTSYWTRRTQIAYRSKRSRPQREFVNEQLTPPEETFTEFKEIIIKMDDQRRLLDFTRTPQIILHRIDVLQEYVCKEEALADQQVCNQEKNSIFDEEEPEPQQIKEEQVELEHLQIKEEEKELWISQDEEQLGLKREKETFVVTPTNDEIFHIEPEANWNQFSSQDSPEIENQDQGEKNPEVSGSKTDEEQMLNKRHQKTRHHNNNSQQKGHKKTHRDKTLYFCEMCDKGFSLNKNLTAHMRIHTGERPFSCKTCGTCFTKKSNLTRHLKTHTGEKPFPCNACKKTFSLKRDLVKHMRIHTGERPFLCMACGKSFRLKFILTEHIRTHTGERPFPCGGCKKTFSLKRNLVKHMRIHTVEKPFPSFTYGKRLKSKGNSKTMLRIHTDEKPLSC
ncbi:zinc finger protein 583-like isoform X2 [Girardinichthys multiradiatus]|uniref:zinc finger protein 583-like isoform X2 n=1 Tax=Girardinichthys multiradiatus TaxID=208333 RepID=UPI001FAD030D|nr:zinc finger protein 583-like isoform X2 [Girardinichthys multiradiatus]